jgi:hypothetical protein
VDLGAAELLIVAITALVIAALVAIVLGLVRYLSRTR